PEPRHAVAAGDSDETEDQDDDDALNLEVAQHAKVKNDNGGDERPQQHEKLTLRKQVGLAGLVDEFGDFAHGAMDWQILQAHVDGHAETQSKDAEQQTDHQEPMTINAKEGHRREVGQFQRGLATGLVDRMSERGCSCEKKQ